MRWNRWLACRAGQPEAALPIGFSGDNSSKAEHLVTKLNILAEGAKMLTVGAGIFSAPFFLASLPICSARTATGAASRINCC
jgi:hypothetical protein